jgi:hypothetical protein
VPSQEWWRTSLEERLSQGDLIANIPLAMCKFPVVHLTKGSGKNGKPLWDIVDAPVLQNGAYHLLATSNSKHALVITHSCELDKGHRNRRVLVAPVTEVSTLDPAAQEQVLSQQSKALLPLPAAPGMETCYADLRLIAPVPRELCEAGVRIASMTESALTRLHTQLVAFLLRREMP